MLLAGLNHPFPILLPITPVEEKEANAKKRKAGAVELDEEDFSDPLKPDNYCYWRKGRDEDLMLTLALLDVLIAMPDKPMWAKNKQKAYKLLACDLKQREPFKSAVKRTPGWESLQGYIECTLLKEATDESNGRVESGGHTGEGDIPDIIWEEYVEKCLHMSAISRTPQHHKSGNINLASSTGLPTRLARFSPR